MHKSDISNNRLTSAPSLWEVKATLEQLQLGYNYIKYINDTYFDFCINIKYIHINFNKLTQFPSLQNIAKTIAVFEVAGNNMSNASFIYGNSFPKPLLLNLEYNQIREFCPPPGIFAPILHTMLLPGTKLSKIHFPLESHRRGMEVFLNTTPGIAMAPWAGPSSARWKRERASWFAWIGCIWWVWCVIVQWKLKVWHPREQVSLIKGWSTDSDETII